MLVCFIIYNQELRAISSGFLIRSGVFEFVKLAIHAFTCCRYYVSFDLLQGNSIL